MNLISENNPRLCNSSFGKLFFSLLKFLLIPYGVSNAVLRLKCSHILLSYSLLTVFLSQLSLSDLNTVTNNICNQLRSEFQATGNLIYHCPLGASII